MTATQQRSSVAPARRGRRAGRRPANSSRLLSAVAGLALAGAAVLLQTMYLDEGEQSLPLTYVGDKGEDVDAKRFTVRVDSYLTAKSITSVTDKTIGTDHLFLVVNASAKSSLKPYKLGQPVLMTEDGKKFSATDRVDSSQTLSNVWVQPDIWVSGRYFFEVPASALPGARVVFGMPQAFIVESYQPEVEVDLGLDEEAARKLAASPQDVYSMAKK
ncbi:hypothetical protein E1292_49830 [Nonomuraea deserti]|uniref:DUF4352 domain-containing protein n=1 Tax=Nonomuraea deserti TaxID=1848322 RepID=A0A4R4U647_9ACTN|nr:hypothetical protein [Nonomuraea deserti]TDC83602.1 hypothetical protein E1292_49830 [Nonomuraea deserti]